MLTVRVKINIASQTTPQIIPVVQGDTGRSVLFEIADFVIPASATATYYIKKPSGQAVYNAATIDGNTVLADLTAQSIAEVGENPGQVRILKNDEVVTSFDFILDVEPFRGIDAIESTTEMNVFDQAVQQAMEEIDGSLENIVADEFDPNDSYLAGEYCLKSGTFYKFINNHTGAWSASDVEAITIGEALTEGGGGGGGGAVNSVNGKTGTVVLDAGDLEYDDEETYAAGSVGAELTSLKEDISDIEENVLTNDIRDALLQLASKVAYIDDDGQDYYDALHDALYPPAELVSISAVYTQSGAIYTSNSLDDLKADLVVTATYDDTTTATVTSYTLSGTLTVGTSTITVSYGGKTDTFDVTVSDGASPIYDWDFTKSMTDSKQSAVATTNPTNTPVTRDENGLYFSAAWQYLDCGAIYDVNRTYEVDVKGFNPQSTSNHMRLLMYGTFTNINNPGTGFLIFRNGNGWSAYNGEWGNVYGNLTTRGSLGTNFTIKVTVASDGTTDLYIDGTHIGAQSIKANGTTGTSHVGIGTNAQASAGGTFYNAYVTGFRVYEGVIE